MRDVVGQHFAQIGYRRLWKVEQFGYINDYDFDNLVKGGDELGLSVCLLGSGIGRGRRRRCRQWGFCCHHCALAAYECRRIGDDPVGAWIYVLVVGGCLNGGGRDGRFNRQGRKTMGNYSGVGMEKRSSDHGIVGQDR